MGTGTETGVAKAVLFLLAYLDVCLAGEASGSS